MSFLSWKIKAHALALLSRVPAGRTVYHTLQTWGGTNRLNVRRDLGRTFELVQLIQKSGTTIAGSTIVEIGTGWRPFVPFVLALGGAHRVLTLDINPWLTLDYAWETSRRLKYFLPEIAAHCHLSEEQVADKYLSIPEEKETLRDLLSRLKIEYIYPGDARDTGLPEHSVDVVLSSNVLEHIPRDVQESIHAESQRILKRNGVAVHRFNPQDHFSTVDATITNANFLRYSTKEWHWYGGSGLGNHNRLRSRDYREMLQAAGLTIEICRERVDERSLLAIQNGDLPIHPEFSGYTPEELAVDYMWMVCRKPLHSRAANHAARNGHTPRQQAPTVTR